MRSFPASPSLSTFTFQWVQETALLHLTAAVATAQGCFLCTAPLFLKNWVGLYSSPNPGKDVEESIPPSLLTAAFKGSMHTILSTSPLQTDGGSVNSSVSNVRLSVLFSLEEILCFHAITVNNRCKVRL